jgi:hypothetical protein
MPESILVGLLILSTLGPPLFAVIILVIVDHAKKSNAVVAYCIGMPVLLVAVAASVGFHVYAVPLHVSWWDWLWLPDAAAIVVTLILALAATVDMLATPPPQPKCGKR